MTEHTPPAKATKATIFTNVRLIANIRSPAHALVKAFSCTRSSPCPPPPPLRRFALPMPSLQAPVYRTSLLLTWVLGSKRCSPRIKRFEWGDIWVWQRLYKDVVYKTAHVAAMFLSALLFSACHAPVACARASRMRSTAPTQKGRRQGSNSGTAVWTCHNGTCAPAFVGSGC